MPGPFFLINSSFVFTCRFLCNCACPSPQHQHASLPPHLYFHSPDQKLSPHGSVFGFACQTAHPAQLVLDLSTLASHLLTTTSIPPSTLLAYPPPPVFPPRSIPAHDIGCWQAKTQALIQPYLLIVGGRNPRGEFSILE